MNAKDEPDPTPVAGEPQTEAGRRLLRELIGTLPAPWKHVVDEADIRAIEAEAARGVTTTPVAQGQHSPASPDSSPQASDSGDTSPAEAAPEAVALLRRIVDTIPSGSDVNGVILAAHEWLGRRAATPPLDVERLDRVRLAAKLAFLRTLRQSENEDMEAWAVRIGIAAGFEYARLAQQDGTGE